MPISLDPLTGTLPRGRYLCDLADLKAEFVDSPWASASSTRREIWDHFERTRELYKDVDPKLATAAWVGGSFTTTRLDPDDIDVTFLLDGSLYAALSNSQKKKVSRLAARDAGNVSHLRSKLGYRIDCFALIVELVAMPWKNTTTEEDTYFRLRGVWDDFWQRQRGGAKDDPPTRSDAEAVRGYFEVLL